MGTGGSRPGTSQETGDPWETHIESKGHIMVSCSHARIEWLCLLIWQLPPSWLAHDGVFDVQIRGIAFGEPVDAAFGSRPVRGRLRWRW
jgi:hypothetical protein